MAAAANLPSRPTQTLANQIRSAVIWRSGSQILAQLVQWAATFLVIRILSPGDYGLFAMTGVVLVFLNMLNGYGLASGLIQREHVSPGEVRQLFGMLIVLNVGLATVQVLVAPFASAYYRQPAIAPLLQVQALMYLTTPFIALPYALLSRAMDFRRQASANVAASIASAATALAGALAGLGVWTLVLAPMVLFTVRAVMLTWSARSLMWPSFAFRGAGTLMRYGGVMATGQLFWFLQSQVDVFVAGRHLTAHTLGIYTTSLFLTQIFVAKFVPPLNEVAFSAYARLQHDNRAVAQAFVQSVRMVFVAAMPFYLGLAATAEPLVLTILGNKWQEAVPVVRLLALAMPFMTLQVLFAPACDAQGRPGVGVRNGAVGAAVLGTAFLIGVQWGIEGLAWAWVASYPVYLGVSTWRSLPVIGASLADLIGAVMPAVTAAVAMAAMVSLVDAALPQLSAPLRLAVLIAAGAAVYAAWLTTFSRAAFTDLIAMIRKRPLPA